MSFINWGMILVLFILLVIATTFIYSSTERNNLRDDDPVSIQDSIRFTISNQTASFSLATASLEGEFEPPFPAAHIILPYRGYGFEVLRKAYATKRAYVTYNVLSNTEVVGSIRIFMKVFATSIPEPSTEILEINGPISYKNGKRYVDVYNA
ncbi:hypothetical protein M3223_16650 [Paenibacillus pasadenensis]|uniref:hypothetical protein n=1 Tax=Paenibacillus pasadenensis TaxID=217090 RepID=UPI00203D4350|nr:hypothetical protein [Paenibacillus pasadenensis]MCM3748987.1 hypothetical protein [Paenibacillus pasadenensis]